MIEIERPSTQMQKSARMENSTFVIEPLNVVMALRLKLP